MLDDRWCDVLIGVEGFALHWGGANDGIIHGPPIMLSFGIDNTGARTGRLLLDDLRLIEGQPGTAAGVETVELTAYRFDAAERWSLRGRGARQGARLEGRTLHYDFTTGHPDRRDRATGPCPARHACGSDHPGPQPRRAAPRAAAAGDAFHDLREDSRSVSR